MFAGGSLPARAARQVKTTAMSDAIRLERFRKRCLPGTILSQGRAVTDRPIPQLMRDLQSSGLNQRRELPQAGNRHAYHRRSNAEAGIHAASVVPYGSRNAAYVEFVFLQIASVAVLSNPVQLNVQLLQIAYGVRSQTPQSQLW